MSLPMASALELRRCPLVPFSTNSLCACQSRPSSSSLASASPRAVTFALRSFSSRRSLVVTSEGRWNRDWCRIRRVVHLVGAGIGVKLKSVDGGEEADVGHAREEMSVAESVNPLQQQHQLGQQQNGQLRNRVIFGLGIGIVSGAIVLAGGWIFAMAVAAAGFIAAREYFGLVRSRGIATGMTPPPRYVSRVCSIICALMPLLTLYLGHMDVSVTSSAFIVAMILILQRGNPRFAQLSSAMFGLFYCGYLPSFWVKLRCGLEVPALNTELGALWPILLGGQTHWTVGLVATLISISSIIAADTCAFLGGKRSERNRIYWREVQAVYHAFPEFQRRRLSAMGFEEFLQIEHFATDVALIRALRPRWDRISTAFIFPWGHMIPTLEDVARITGLRVHGKAVSGKTHLCYRNLADELLGLKIKGSKRTSLLPRRELQESLGIKDLKKELCESADAHMLRLTESARQVLQRSSGPEADKDLRRFLIFFLGKLLLGSRGDPVSLRHLPLLRDLPAVGGYAWGAALLAHLFTSLGTSDRPTMLSGFHPFLQIWFYLYFPSLNRGILRYPGAIPLARRYVPNRDTRTIADQTAALQEALDELAPSRVVWTPYDGEIEAGQVWVTQGRPYFGREIWLHDLNTVERLFYRLIMRTLGRHQALVEFPTAESPVRRGRKFRGLNDNINWAERVPEELADWESRGTGITIRADGDTAYMTAYTERYASQMYQGRRREMDREAVIGRLTVLLDTTTRERNEARQSLDALRAELDRVRANRGDAGASTSTQPCDHSDLEAQLEEVLARAQRAEAALDEKKRELEQTKKELEQSLQRSSEEVELRREVESLRKQMEGLRSENLVQRGRIEGMEIAFREMGRRSHSSRSESRSRSHQTSRSHSSVSRPRESSAGGRPSGSGRLMLPPPDPRVEDQGEGSGEGIWAYTTYQ